MVSHFSQVLDVVINNPPNDLVDKMILLEEGTKYIFRDIYNEIWIPDQTDRPSQFSPDQ